MPETTSPYVEARPGDLITSEMWNRMQSRIQQDIAATVDRAVHDIHDVDHAGDAGRLDGKTAGELADAIVERAIREMRERSGYLRIHTVLKAGAMHKIEHKLGDMPEIQIYRLEYFPVVYREDDQTYLSWATFYLRHSSESRIRFSAGNRAVSVELESPSSPPFKLKFSNLLERYHVSYDDDSSLDDLETEFWQAFFAGHNEGFDDDQYGHSPWFERCCGERRSVRELKRAGDWDELWLQMMPVKTAIFLPFGDAFGGSAGTGGNTASLVGPVVVDVFHTDFDTTALALRPAPKVTYSEEAGWRERLKLPAGVESPLRTIAETFPDSATELKVMVLLKV
jgi:hypothetical protein